MTSTAATETERHISPAHEYAAHMARSLGQSFPVEARFTCTWHVERTSLVGDDEYGYEPWTWVEECGAPALGFAWGWACAKGHTHHTYGGIAHVEYAEDEYELRRIEAHGGRAALV